MKEYSWTSLVCNEYLSFFFEPAHRSILLSCCTILANIFKTVDNRESDQITFITPDFSLRTVQKFLELVYVGSTLFGKATELDDVIKFGSKHLGFVISLDQKVLNKQTDLSDQNREVINLEEDSEPKADRRDQAKIVVDSDIGGRPELGSIPNDSGLGASICQLPTEDDFVEIIDDELRTSTPTKDSVAEARNKESQPDQPTELEIIEIDSEPSIVNNKPAADNFNKAQSDIQCIEIDPEPTLVVSKQIPNDGSIEIVDLEKSDFNDDHTSENNKPNSSTKRLRKESGHFNKKSRSEESQLKDKILQDLDVPLRLVPRTEPNNKATDISHLKTTTTKIANVTTSATVTTTEKSQHPGFNTLSSAASSTTATSGLRQGVGMVRTTIFVDNLEESLREISKEMKCKKKMTRLMGNSATFEIVAGGRHGYKTRNNTIKTSKEKPKPKRFQRNQDQ